MNYRWPFLVAAVILSAGAAAIAYVLAVDIQSDADLYDEKS
ncbi:MULTISPECIES: hypothetical protein [Nocardiaceae]|nr:MULTISPECIES: hypothetical protein [Rhodococcus]